MIIDLPKLGPVKFRDDLTDAQIRQQIQALAEKYDFQLPKADVGIGTLLKRGFMRGLGETGIALGDVLPAMGASALGFEDYAKQQMGEAAASREKLQEKYPTQFQSYKEVGGPFEALQYGAETLGELGPSALTAMIPGVGFGAVGTRMAGQAALRGAMAAGPVTPLAIAAAKEAGATAGRRAMYGGVYLGSLSQTAPEIFQGIYEETGKMEPGIAALAGGIAASLDTIVPGKLLDSLGTYGKLKAVEKIAKETGAAPKVWKYIGAEAAKAAAAEGLTESAQEAIGIAAEKIAGSTKDFFDPKNVDRLKESFVKGAIGGGAFGTVGGVGKALQERSAIRQDQRNTQEAEQAIQAQMEAERAAGTLTPEKQAEYDTALKNAREQREKELAATFEGLPEFDKQRIEAAKAERQQREAAMRPEEMKAFSARFQQTKAMQDLDAWVAKAQAEIEAARQKRDEELAAGSIFSERGPTPGTGGLYRPGLEQQREERREAKGQEQRGLRSFAFGEPTAEDFAQQVQTGTRQFAFESEPPAPQKPAPAGKKAAPPAAPALDLATVTKIDDPKAFGKLFGIGRTATILKDDGPLAGKDISKPEDAAVVKQALEAYASGKPAKDAAAKIEEFLKRPEFGEAGATRTDTAPSGVGTQVAGQPPAGAAPGTIGTSERGGVDNTTPPAGRVETPATTEPSAVTEPSSLGLPAFTSRPSSIGQPGPTVGVPGATTFTIPDGTQTAQAQQAEAQGQEAPAPATTATAVPEVTPQASALPDPNAPTYTELGIRAKQAYERVKDIRDQMGALLSKNGRPPATNTAKREQWNALGEQEAAAMEEFGKADAAFRKAQEGFTPRPVEASETGSTTQLLEEPRTVPRKIFPLPDSAKRRIEQDVPTEEWVATRTQLIESKGRDEFGVPAVISPTGRIIDPVMVPVEKLLSVSGVRGSEVNKPTLDHVSRDWDYFVNSPLQMIVPYDGQPFLRYGLPVVQVAQAKGVTHLPVEIIYYDGGQQRSNEFNPTSLLQDDLRYKKPVQAEETDIGDADHRAALEYARRQQDVENDVNVINQQLGKARLSPVEKAAHAYFSKVVLPLAIKAIAFDLVNPVSYRNSSMKLPSVANALMQRNDLAGPLKAAVEPEPLFHTKEEAAFFAGQGTESAIKAAEWIRANLSQTAIDYLQKYIDLYGKQSLKADAAYNRQRILQLLSRDVASQIERETAPAANVAKEEIERRRTAKRALGTQERKQNKRSSDIIDGEGLITEAEEKALLEYTVDEQLTAEQIARLENAYGGKKGSQAFFTRLRKDVANYVNKGAESVAKNIRDIIKAVVAAVLSIGFIFNPNFVSNSEAVVVHQPAAVQQQAVQVPANAAPYMSEAAQTAYKSLFGSLKNDLQQRDKLLVIADKPTARMFVFNPDGSLLIQKKTLFGAAVGDYLKGSNVLPQNRITPAGLFNLGLRDAARGGSEAKTAGEYDFGKVFVLDKAIDGEYSVTIMHSVWLKESDAAKRVSALKNESPADSRYSFGCINVDRDTFEYLIKNHGAQMDGAKLFVVPDNQNAVKEFLAGGAKKDDLVRQSIEQAFGTAPAAEVFSKPANQPMANIAGMKASVEQAMLHREAHPAVLGALYSGSYADAMGFLSESASSPFYRMVAQKLMPFMKGVNVVADAAESMYDPATNTVYLREGATEYEILHEGAHAALSHVIANPSHPVTKQLTQIFNTVRAGIDGAYGAQNLQEFVAEMWSNDSLRNVMQALRPDGQPVSMWGRFLNTLRRWFGLPQKSGTALDRIDGLLDEIVSQPPESRQGDTLFAQAITQPDLGRQVFRAMESAATSLPGMTSDRAVQYLAKMEGLSTLARRGAYKLLNLPAFSEVASKVVGPAAKEFSRIVEQMEGYQHKLLEAMYPLNRRLQEYTQTPEYQQWSTLVHETTIEDVAPYPERQKDYVGSPTKEAQWKEFNRRFKALTPEGQQLYRDLFATYKRLDKELESSLKINVTELVGEDKALTAYDRIMQQLASIRIDHYAPLYREGTFWLNYEINGVPYRPAFSTAVERDAAVRQLEAQGVKNIEQFSRVDELKSSNVPDGTMLASIVKIMQDSGAGSESIDKLVQVIVKALPETSILKSRQARQGIAGYIDNAAYTFSRVGANSAQQLARMRYGETLQSQLKTMREVQKPLRGAQSAMAKEMIDEFDERRSFAMSPDLSAWSRYASAGAYYFNIAGNVSSAVVQLLQTPMVAYPQLGGEYGYGKAGKALLNALNLYRSSGFKRKVEELSGSSVEEAAMLSIENLVNKGMGDTAKYRSLYDALKGRGLLQSSTVYDALQMEQQVGQGLSQGGRFQRIAGYISNGMFHHSERMNREITAVAAYDLEMDNPKNKGTEAERQARAIEKAVKAVQFSHGATGALTGPSIAQNDLGRVLTVFKRFAFSMYYMLFDTIFRALPKKGATAEEQEYINAARRQLAGVYGMAALFAGVKGLPLYWIAEAAYNMFQGDDDDDFDAVMRKFLGEFLFKGPLNYVTNLSIADRVGWTDLIFRENKSDKADASFMARTLEALLGAPYAMVDSIFRAKDLIADGHYERGIEAMLPVALRNVLKGTRYATEGANTLRGDPVMGEISGYNSAMQVLGFAPADLIRQYEENSYGKTKDKAIGDGVKRQLKRYYAALREGDAEGMSEAREKLFEIAAKYPELGISENTITKSVRARDKMSQDMYLHHGVSYNKKLTPVIERAIAEFE